MSTDKRATHPLINRITLVFDFDDTLAPATTEKVFEAYDLDYDGFRQNLSDMMDDGWDYALAKAELFRRLGIDITEERLRQVGDGYELFPEAETMVQRLRDFAADLDEGIELEFILLTAGFLTIPRASQIGEQFDRLYGGELHFDADDGHVICAKRIITHVDKVHYLNHIAKGTPLERQDMLEESYLDIDPADYHVPFGQLIYVGDGASDLSAFQEVERKGGIAIGIELDEGNWDQYDQVAPQRRVHNLVQADYADDSELMRSLKLALRSMIAEVGLIRLSRGE